MSTPSLPPRAAPEVLAASESSSADPEARVPVITEEDVGSVEFW